MTSIKKKDVAEWIRASQFWRDNNETDDNEEIVFKYYISDFNITNLEEFDLVFNTCCFVNIDQLPCTIFVYAYYSNSWCYRNVMKDHDLHFHLYDKLKNKHYEYFKKNFSEYRYNDENKFESNALKYLANNDFPENEIEEYIKALSNKNMNDGQKWENNPNRVLDNILLNYNKSQYFPLLKDIDSCKTLIDKSVEYVGFYKNNLNYYKAKEFIQDYNNTFVYNFELMLAEERIDQRGYNDRGFFKIILNDSNLFNWSFRFNYMDLENIPINNILENLQDISYLRSHEEIPILSGEYLQDFEVYIKPTIFNRKYLIEEIKKIKERFDKWL